MRPPRSPGCFVLTGFMVAALSREVPDISEEQGDEEKEYEKTKYVVSVGRNVARPAFGGMATRTRVDAIPGPEGGPRPGWFLGHASWRVGHNS